MEPTNVSAFYGPEDTRRTIAALRRAKFLVSNHPNGGSRPIYDHEIRRAKKDAGLVGFLTGQEIEAYSGQRLDQFMRAYQE